MEPSKKSSGRVRQSAIPQKLIKVFARSPQIDVVALVIKKIFVNLINRISVPFKFKTIHLIIA